MKSYTDLPQSKKLAEILPLESADMRYAYIAPYIPSSCDDIVYTIDFGKPSDIDIPCWSLAALFDVLPNFIRGYGKCLYYDDGEYYCGYMVDGHFMLIAETKADNQIDACYEMIIRLNELKLL